MTNQQVLEQAGAQVGLLATAAGIRPMAMALDLAGVGAEMLPSLLGHELIAGHAAMMRLTGKLNLFLDQIVADRPAAEQDRACKQACQLSAAAARLTERYRLGLMSLARLQRWAGAGSARRSGRSGRADPADDFDDDPLGDGPDGGPGGGGRRKSTAAMLAELAALEKSMDAMLQKAQAKAAKPNGHDTGAQAQPAPDRACAPESGSARRGRLRHGNPSGDFLAAPRCGAKTRAGCVCRQPAMKNGRCRLHGGKSTGARTAAGLARCRTATLVHGHRTAEIIDLKSAAARHSRNLKTLTRLARAANPQSERPIPVGAGLRPAHLAAAPMSTSSHAISSTASTAPTSWAGLRPAPTNDRSDRPTPCQATSCLARKRKTADERGSSQMNANGADARLCHLLDTSAFIPSYLRLILSAARSARRRASVAKPLPATAPGPQSERPTPCPATTTPAIHSAAVLFDGGTGGNRTTHRDHRRRHSIAAAA